jgi:hypothetical protein
MGQDRSVNRQRSIRFFCKRVRRRDNVMNALAALGQHVEHSRQLARVPANGAAVIAGALKVCQLSVNYW